MPTLALAVMLRIVGACGVDDASHGGADETAALPVGTGEVVGGHAPGDVLAVGLGSFLHGYSRKAFLNTFMRLVPDVILRMKSKVLYGRIHGALEG